MNNDESDDRYAECKNWHSKVKPSHVKLLFKIFQSVAGDSVD